MGDSRSFCCAQTFCLVPVPPYFQLKIVADTPPNGLQAGELTIPSKSNPTANFGRPAPRRLLCSPDIPPLRWFRTTSSMRGARFPERVVFSKINYETKSVLSRTNGQFYDAEKGHLGRIFHSHKKPPGRGTEHQRSTFNAGKVGSRQTVSNGAHEAIVFCIECKNDPPNISCEFSAELVSCIANSSRVQLNGEHRAPFHAWRVSAIGNAPNL